MVTMTLGEALAIVAEDIINPATIRSPAETTMIERARAVIAEHYQRLLKKFDPDA
jgi:hypothetical protein